MNMILKFLIAVLYIVVCIAIVVQAMSMFGLMGLVGSVIGIIFASVALQLIFGDPND